MKKIYFAASIRGGREDGLLYAEIVEFLKKRAVVLTEHIGLESVCSSEKFMTDEQIYLRDRAWLEQADLVIAEVSVTSLGVGYELGLAEALGKPVFVFYRKNADKKLSAMISGDKYFGVRVYDDKESLMAELEKIVG